MPASSDPIAELSRERLKARLRGLPVAVLGLGKSGIAAARALSRCGARVFVSESESGKRFPDALKPLLRSGKIRCESGGHTRRILENRLIVVSPGIHLDLPVIEEARRRGIPVWNELELGFRLTSFKKIAAVTGTNGKTTTVSLLGDMARRDGRRTLVAGNIGKPLSDLSHARSRFEVAVLEVSSYQLESVAAFHPRVAAVLNLTSDHLARHKTMAGYARAKARIFLNQSPRDFAVLNAEDAGCRKMARSARSRKVWFSSARPQGGGVFFDKKRPGLAARFPGKKGMLRFPLPAHLPGLHNIENACAAVACALGLGLRPAAIRAALLDFKGVEHRIEKVRTLRGVTYVNDSKGTNVDSTVKAIESFARPMWLILGGQDKGGSYRPIRDLIGRPRGGGVKGVFLIGEAAPLIRRALKGACPLYDCRTLERAVRLSARLARPGDLVLLSPACASFDQFEDFEDRGRRFKGFVAALR